MENIFKITIGSAASGVLGAAIGDHLLGDRNIIKAALLYADKVYICSPMGNLINSIHKICSLPQDAKFEDKLKLIDWILINTSLKPELAILLSSYTQIKSIKHPNKDILLLKQKLTKEINMLWNNFQSGNYEHFGGQVVNELLNLYKLDLLEYHFFNVTKDNLTDELLSQFSDVIVESISNPYSYPLLDDLSGQYISELIKSGMIKVDSSEINHSKHTALAANLFKRLPYFELASMDEILDIRSELKPSLIRFRQAMIDLSESIQNSQWDKNFKSEVEILFRKSIEPTIIEIDENIRSKSYLKSLTSRFAEKPHLFPIPILGLFAATQMSGYDMITSIVSSAIVTGANLYEVYNNLKKEKLSVEHNQLFFYYKAINLMNK